MGVNIQPYNKPLIARPGQRLLNHLREVLENGSKFIDGISEDKIMLFKAGLFFHDVGKAEFSIQDALHQSKKPPISHTHLSLIFFYSWLQDFLKKELYELLKDSTLRTIGFGILSHHSVPHIDLEFNIFCQIFNREVIIAKEIFEIFNQFNFLIREEVFLKTFDEFVNGYKENYIEFHFRNALKNELRKKFVIFYNALVKNDLYSAIGEIQTLKDTSQIKRNFIDPNRSEVHSYIAHTQTFTNNVLLQLPTGFGKTFLGLGYALKTNKKRIFYTLPVTTIIEDVYQRLKDYIPQENFGWYTSTYLVRKIAEKEEITQLEYLELKYFEKPLIITTLDQILLTFIGIHRYPLKEASLYDSCIILDEPQLYSPLMLFLFFKFFEDYKNELNCIMMTATVPDYLRKKLTFFEEPFASKREEFFNKFNRTYLDTKYLGYKIQDGKFQAILKKEICKLLSEKKKIAIVFNTVEKAQKFYNENLPGCNKYLFHARYIYQDRVSKLNELKSKLEKSPLIVVSTQTIEAGVDISFDVMFRELAPFDSIFQSAGRVNRFSENSDLCPIYVFGNVDDYLPYEKYQLEVTKDILAKSMKFNEFEMFESLQNFWKKIMEYISKEDEEAEKIYKAVKKVSPFAINLAEEKVNLRKGYFKIAVIPIKFYNKIKDLLEKLKNIEKNKIWERKKIISEIESYMVDIPFWGKSEEVKFKDFIIEDEDINFIGLKYSEDLGLIGEEDMSYRIV